MSSRLHIVPRAKLDQETYDACISRSEHCKIYAFAWYLDALCHHWYALVLGDYEAVMPVPYRIKFGVKYVYQPMMVQQLGVFSSDTIDETPFYRLLKRHLLVDYTAHSIPGHFNSKPRPNFILDLDTSINSLYSNLNQNRRRDLKRAEKSELKIRVSRDVDDVNVLATIGSDWSIPEIHRLKKLFDLNSAKAEVKIAIVSKGDVDIQLLLFGIDARRIYYLLPVSLHDLARQSGASTFVVWELIKLYSKSHKFFDFEGSSIDGVSRFYKGFGAYPEYYQYFNHRVWLMRIFGK